MPCAPVWIRRTGGSELNHVLVIPDGNRRYARANSLSLEDAYREAATVVMPELLRFFLVEGRAAQLIIYAVSYYNVTTRDRVEVDPILRAQAAAYESWRHDAELATAGLRFRFVGEMQVLPSWYRQACQGLEKDTQGRGGPECVLLTAYDGEVELLKALGRAARARSAPTDDASLRAFLDIGEPLDLVVRMGNEMRLSGAPLLPCSYAELVFVEDYFPALTREKLDAIWATFCSRKRQFGR